MSTDELIKTLASAAAEQRSSGNVALWMLMGLAISKIEEQAAQLESLAWGG